MSNQHVDQAPDAAESLGENPHPARSLNGATSAAGRERKRIRAAQAWLAAIIDSSDDAIVSKDLNGVITSWNRAAERIFGYTADEAIGRPVTILIPPDRLNEEVEILSRIRRGLPVEHYETVRRRKDGSLLDVSVTVSPIVDDSGEVVGASKIARDIGDRKRAEEAIRDSERRFRELLDALPAAVYTTDAEGRVTHFNQAAVELAGRVPEIGRDHWCVSWKLHRPDGTVLPHEECPMAVALKEGRIIRGAEIIAERPDGRRIWVTPFPALLHDANGNITGGVNMLVDVTDRKLAAVALKEANRRKDEFLAMLAHELRNPLAPLRNAVEVMRMAAQDAEPVQSAADIMERQISQMVRLVDDLLDVSRISRGKIELRRERIELSEIIAQAVEACRPAIDEAGHALNIVPPPAPILLDADPVRLAQVFGNLLNNACKYTPPQGEIGVSVEVREGEALISVKDNGVGIPPDNLRMIFELFTQVEQSLKRSEGGLGIGLTVVERLVALHGGSVEARSEGLGAGSEFIVRLPVLAEAPQSTHATSPSRNSSAAGRRILVVDDNRDSAHSLATLLKLLGHHAEAVYDGAEAVLAASTLRPDLVLLDIGLPKLNGYEVARRIRQQPGGDRLLLVALTGWGQEEDRKRSKEAGFDHHMVKPIDRDALIELLA